MPNMCDWILRAQCRDMDDARELADGIRGLPGQMTGVSHIHYEKEDGGAWCLETDGECAWNLDESGMVKALTGLSCGRTIEVFSDYATKLREDGSVLSDSWQEHLKISDGNVETHDFADSIPNYGEFSI